MENREKVVADYLKLRVLLNKPNAKSNEKTELGLFIQRQGSNKFKLFANLSGVKDSKILILCEKEPDLRWKGAGFSGLSDLEDFCCAFLDTNISQNPTSLEIENLVEQIKRILRSLGIP